MGSALVCLLPVASGLSVLERLSEAPLPLIEAVAGEIERLLATRRRPSLRLQAETVLDYGIADWSGRYALSATDRERIANEVLQAIRSFEPRLLEPQVSLLEPAGGDSLSLLICGRLAQNASGAALVLDMRVDLSADGGVEGGMRFHERID